MGKNKLAMKRTFFKELKNLMCRILEFLDLPNFCAGSLYLNYFFVADKL